MTSALTASRRTTTRPPGDSGVVFLPFDPEIPPEVLVDDSKLRIKTFDSGSQFIPSSMPLLVLSVGVRPHPGARELAGKLELPMMPEGFFLEADPKLNPLEFSSSGIYRCGLAHSPRTWKKAWLRLRGPPVVQPDCFASRTSAAAGLSLSSTGPAAAAAWCASAPVHIASLASTRKGYPSSMLAVAKDAGFAPPNVRLKPSPSSTTPTLK